MPEIRRPVEYELIKMGVFQPYQIEKISQMTQMDVESRRFNVESALMTLFQSFGTIPVAKVSGSARITDPRFEYILHLIAIKYNDKNLSLCLYAKEEPVYGNLLSKVWDAIEQCRGQQFTDVLGRLEQVSKSLFSHHICQNTDHMKLNYPGYYINYDKINIWSSLIGMYLILI